MSDAPDAMVPPENLQAYATLETKVDQLLSRGEQGGKKDLLDRVTAIATLITAMAALLGMIVTYQLNTSSLRQQEQLQRNQLAHDARGRAEQYRIDRLEALSPFLPILTGNDEAKKEWAIRALSDLGGPEFAAMLAGLHPSTGTAAGLRSIRESSNVTAAERAIIDTVLQGLPRTLRPPATILLPDRPLLQPQVAGSEIAPKLLARMFPVDAGRILCGINKDPRGAIWCGGRCDSSINQRCGYFSAENSLASARDSSAADELMCGIFEDSNGRLWCGGTCNKAIGQVCGRLNLGT